jgi:hypothetical protein
MLAHFPQAPHSSGLAAWWTRTVTLDSLSPRPMGLLPAEVWTLRSEQQVRKHYDKTGEKLELSRFGSPRFYLWDNQIPGPPVSASSSRVQDGDLVWIMCGSSDHRQLFRCVGTPSAPVTLTELLAHGSIAKGVLPAAINAKAELTEAASRHKWGLLRGLATPVQVMRLCKVPGDWRKQLNAANALMAAKHTAMGQAPKQRRKRGRRGGGGAARAGSSSSSSSGGSGSGGGGGGGGAGLGVAMQADGRARMRDATGPATGAGNAQHQSAHGVGVAAQVKKPKMLPPPVQPAPPPPSLH